ncbi:MAG: efflux RND transporter permease subunit [Planctomycetes bacterium]|nr:efflux RND transporter permease subunit [Planctomycetota bacterium]MCB9934213.1 efflux RND transporter permease subunit [Planctomycetota bacterium]
MSDSPAKPRPSRFFEIVTTRPVAVLCVVAAFIVFGGVALTKLQTTLMPDLEYPQLTIRTGYPAAAPSEVEEKVSQRIEERLGNVEGLIDRSSISRAESSDVILKFAWGTDMLEATADVRDRLDRIGFDDDEVERPQILRYDPAQDPTMRITLFATSPEVDLLDLRAFAEDILKPELSKIEGVAAVRVSGGEERQIRISLIEAKLNQYGLTAEQVKGRIRAARVDMSAGIIELAGRDVILRVVSTYDSLDVLQRLEIVSGSEQGRVTLKEIADIEQVPKERETITRFAGPETGFRAREGVLLEVLKEGDANIVEVAKRVWVALYGEDKYESIRERRGEVGADEARGGATEVKESGRRGRMGGRGMRGPAGGFTLGKKSLVDQLPEGFGLKVVSDQSYFIEDAVNDVTASAILGAFLAVLVLFFFLRSVKATVLIAAAIPLSIVTTFIPMQLTSVTLNLMSLGGLALGVGMLVDNSVVVIESIARCREEGDPPLQAAVRGISEVGGAILASTMTTVAVFFPIVFVEGVAGQIFRDLSLTVVFSLLASLIVAQFVVPAMFGISAGGVAQLGKFTVTQAVIGYMRPPSDVSRWRKLGFWLNRVPQFPVWVGVLALVASIDGWVWIIRWFWRGMAFVFALLFKPFGWAFELVWKAIENTYPLLLRMALAQPLVVVLATAGTALVALLLAGSLSTELLPRFQQDEIYVDLAAPEGTQILDTDREAAALVRQAFADEGFEAEVSRVTYEVGGEEQAGESRAMGSHHAHLVVTLKKSADARAASPMAEARLREVADDSTLFQGSAQFSSPALVKVESGLSIEVRGDNYERLGRIANRLVKALNGLRRDDGEPLLSDVRSSLQAGRPQVQLEYDRQQLQRFGLSADQVTNEVRNKIGGSVSTQFTSGGEDLEVFVELLMTDKSSLNQVRELEIAKGVRLRDVLARGGEGLRVTEGPSEIRRVGNERAVVITCEPNNVALSTARGAVEEMLAGGAVDLEDAQVGFSGQVEEMESSILSLILALSLAVFLVYVVMAVQFESLVDPLIIMFSVPFAGVGVVVALWLFNLPVSVMVLLGSIVLAGIVVNNAIVLVNYANQLRARGQSANEAALNASRIRLRPIAITTLTTLLGLLPMTGWLDPFLPAVQAVAGGIDSVLTGVVEGMGRGMTAPASWKLIGGWKFSLARGVGFLVGGGEGAEVRKPLAITVIAGLTLSTLLTLVVIPTLWAWVNNLRGRAKMAREEDQ